jgi:hypothetical protein
LAAFLDKEGVEEFLSGLLGDASVADWQKLWVLAVSIRAMHTCSDGTMPANGTQLPFVAHHG